eukprot:m.231254 g.231254  ORF g.231254 m.231254 type:complete len:202 (-) comp18869_c0_seq9:130-735(-)
MQVSKDHLHPPDFPLEQNSPLLDVVPTRLSPGQEVVLLVTNRSYMALLVGLCLGAGSYTGWTSVLNQILQPLDFSAQDVNWIGFATSMVALPSGVFFALLIDKAKGVSFRCLLFVQFTVAAACFAWISLAASGVLPHERNAIIAASMLIGICITGCNALAYEAAIEVVYPVGEVMSSTVSATDFSCTALPLGSNKHVLGWM